MHYEIDKLKAMLDRIDTLSIPQIQEFYKQIHGEIKRLTELVVEIDIKLDRYMEANNE